MVEQPRFVEFNSSSLTVEWNTGCIDQTLSHGYQITFCQVGSQKDNPNCTDTPRTVNVTGAAIHSYTIKDLVPYRGYKVTIAAQSDTSIGPSSDPIFWTTLEAAPTEPRDLKVVKVTNTSIDLEWDPPAEINGVLNRYTVYYNGSKVDVNRNEDRNKSVPFTLENLAAHTYYHISVVAWNGATNSKPSRPVIQRTDISNPSEVHLASESSDVIMWKPPTVAAGNLDYYEMLVNRSNRLDYVYLKDTKCTLAIDPCEANHNVVFQLRAVNVRYSPHAGPAPVNLDR